jgi:hypothetical protein
MYFAGHVLIDRDSAVSAVKSLKKASRLQREGAFSPPPRLGEG